MNAEQIVGRATPEEVEALVAEALSALTEERMYEVRAPNTTMKLYGPFRGQHGQAKAVNECMRLQLGNPRFAAEGWKCEAMPILSAEGGK